MAILVPLLLIGGAAVAVAFTGTPKKAEQPAPRPPPPPPPPLPHYAPSPPPTAARLQTFTAMGSAGQPLAYLDDTSTSAVDQLLAGTYLRQLELPPQIAQQMTIHEVTKTGTALAKQTVDLSLGLGLPVLVTTAPPFRVAFVKAQYLYELAQPGRSYAVYRPRPGEALRAAHPGGTALPVAPPTPLGAPPGMPPGPLPPSMPSAPPPYTPVGPAPLPTGPPGPPPGPLPPMAPTQPTAPGLPPQPPGMPPPPPTVPPAPVAPPAPAAPTEPLPPAVQTEVQKLMTDPTVDPWALDEAANNLQAAYPQTAAMLRKRANELRAAQQLRDQQRGGSEWTIRSGDIPSRLALHYTGVANRWKEIPGVNPGMIVKTVDNAGTKTTVLHPWIVGSKILLPVSWAIWAKPPPPVARGSIKTAASPTTTTSDPVDRLRTELAKLGDMFKPDQGAKA